MAESHLVLCGEVRSPRLPNEWRGAVTHRLEIGRGPCDVRRGLDPFTAAMHRGISDIGADLIDVAAYIYSADQAITRGGIREFEYGERWHRQFRFEIPVRCPDMWNRLDVQEELRAAVGFLTDDTYEFRFHQATNPPQLGKTLLDVAPPRDEDGFEEVILFSGGLDSLCGAVEEILIGQRRVVLVSHRPMNRIYARQKRLVELIRSRLPRAEISPLHVAVTVNKGRNLNRDFTQRSRSFLFASVATVIARLDGRKRIRFYENGVTSLNLPVSPQVIGGRASRTTHPQSLFRFGELFSLLFETEFEVQNPYQWQTKADILRRLRSFGHADLCGHTCSCGHIWGRQEDRPHCGRCSQCVDRRVGALAAGLNDFEDPPSRYESDVFVGERDGHDLTFIERYYGSSRELERLDSTREFAMKYPEVNHAIRFIAGPANQTVEAMHRLYRRHSEDVSSALRKVALALQDDLVRQNVPSHSLLGTALVRCRCSEKDSPGSSFASLNGTASGNQLVIDHTKFEARQGNNCCSLGNTLEFRLLDRLHQGRGQYLSNATLMQDVWNDAQVQKNTIQKTISNLRRKLNEEFSTSLVIDGSQKGHYRLVWSPL
jgi:hypothetical protein